MNSTGDQDDVAAGDGTCATTGAVCTLRAAIQEANALPGTDTISFGLVGPTPTIAPLTELPALVAPFVVNGNTGGATKVRIDGASAPPTSDGFTLTGTGTVANPGNLRNMVVSNFGRGILVAGTSLTVTGNWVGLDSVSTDLGNAQGIVVSGGANTVNGNDIAWSAGAGMTVSGDGNFVRGNRIGVDRTGGDDPVPNDDGVLVTGDNNLIGGPVSGDRNIISGNASVGVRVAGGNGNDIQGNYIGISANGNSALPNGLNGVRVAGGSNTIGGGIAGERNIIGGNGGYGVWIESGTANSVQGNYIGTDSAGTVAVPNNQGGVLAAGVSSTVTANVISGHTIGLDNAGIVVSSSGASITGMSITANLIGVTPDGVTPMPNNSGIAVVNTGDVQNVTIGTPSAPNTIAHNLIEGVHLWELAVLRATGREVRTVTIRANTMHSNGALAINFSEEFIQRPQNYTMPVNLDPDRNDAGDVDNGPNDRQNAPVITGITIVGTDTHISGTFAGVPSSTTYTFDFYNNTNCEPNGWGEAQSYLGAWQATTLPNGTISWSVFFAGVVPAANGITVTATRMETGSYKETSELSRCFSRSGQHDADGIPDSADNCMGLANAGQANTFDRNFIELGPAKAFDDVTVAMSDNIGDDCDWDDDNDGLPNDLELMNPPCYPASGPTDPTNADTDGDRFRDYAECNMLTNPLDPNSKPTPSQCGPNTDGDLDRVPASREFCLYGTSDSFADTDGDGCNDGRETASINGDLIVNAIDLSQVAGAFGLYAVGSPAYKYNFDITKDGNISASDLSILAGLFGPCP